MRTRLARIPLRLVTSIGLVALVAALAVAVSRATPAAAQAGPGADCEGGMANEYPCENIDMYSFLPLPGLGEGNGNDLWGWTDPETGNEYAIIGSSLATGFVDVTDPTSPTVIGQLPSETPNYLPLWRDIKVIGNYAYIVSEYSDHGMQVFDLTKLRDASQGTIFEADALYRGGPGDEQLGHVHNVVANPDTDFVYPVGSNTCSNEAQGDEDGEDGGLHAVDVSDPLNPTFAGCAIVPIDGDEDTPNNNYVHDAQCVVYDGPDTEHEGQEICVGANEDAVVVYNVTDKANPEILSITPYETAGYTHQGWFTPDQRYWIFGDEGDETGGTVDNTTTYILDLQDLDSPPTPKAFAHETPVIDHNLYLDDEYVWQSNYAAGLRVLDYDDQLLAEGVLEEVAFFDTFPAGDPTEFVGTWSNYIDFPSGTVAVSNIFTQQSGLFLLDPNVEKLSVADAGTGEGDDGTTALTFPVTLSGEEDDTVTVDFTTRDGTATAGEDYEATSGTLTFEPGETSKQITVDVTGDADVEPAETFAIELSEPDKALLGKAEATGTIRDDDESPGEPEGPTSACDPEFVPSADFEDIAGNVHDAAIECIAWYHITVGQGDTDGDGNNEYAPGEPVSRAQMTSYLGRLAVEGGVDLPADPEDAFADDADSVHHDKINALAELGIVRGVGDTDGDGNDEFDPSGTVSRAQMASFIARTHELVTGSLPASPPDAFSDDDASQHHLAINQLAELGVVEGQIDGDDADGDGDTSERLYFPDRDVGRDQMATFMANDLRLFVDAGAAYAGGATVTLDETSAAPGEEISGVVRTNKRLVSLSVSGCGTSGDVDVAGDGSFAVQIPESQEAGDCSVAFTASTRPLDARRGIQSVPYTFPVSVTAAQ